MITAAAITRIVDRHVSMPLTDVAKCFAHLRDLGAVMDVEVNGVRLGTMPRGVLTAVNAALAHGDIELSVTAPSMSARRSVVEYGFATLRSVNEEIVRTDRQRRALLRRYGLANGQVIATDLLASPLALY